MKTAASAAWDAIFLILKDIVQPVHHLHVFQAPIINTTGVF